MQPCPDRLMSQLNVTPNLQDLFSANLVVIYGRERLCS